MTIKSAIKSFTQIEQINFLITNRIPRRWATLFIGWFSRIENPFIASLSIKVWHFFADDMNLEESQSTHFKSMHDCFTRRIKSEARPLSYNKDILISPCDAIIGEHGKIQDTQLIQSKGFPYTLEDLLINHELIDRYRDGSYITLRLTSGMYHHFHAPDDCKINRIYYISGDTWNVNPVSLKRIEKLFCKNERAIIDIEIPHHETQITMVAVAAILVASIRFNFLKYPLNLNYRGTNIIDTNSSFSRGDEIGYFEHGSTIILFAQQDFRFCTYLKHGDHIKMGQPIFQKH